MAAVVAIHWFRKGLRLHDNPALIEACKGAKQVTVNTFVPRATPCLCSFTNFGANAFIQVYPMFFLDPHFAKPELVGVNRYRFLLQSLA